MTASCPACGSGALEDDFATRRLSVQRCVSCGHRIAEHAAAPPVAEDHDQYDPGAFLDALRATRTRQARALLRWIRAAAPAATTLIDFGCGRGWFLDEARAVGWQVSGADTSAKAVSLLRERGIPAFELDPEAHGLPRTLRKPEVLTLLDVIQHFPPAELLGRVTALAAAADLLVVKVPTSAGLLYKASSLLGRAGRGAPIEQLYQVGSAPPHHHYFTARSLRVLLQRAGLRIVAQRRDRDFEPSALADRAGLRLPAPLVRLAGTGAAATAFVLRMEDSVIALATAAAPGAARPERNSSPAP